MSTKDNMKQPFVQRGAFYALAFAVVAVCGAFGWVNAEQASSIQDALPSIVAWLFGAASPLLALFNLHRGSDSKVTEDDLVAVVKEPTVAVVPEDVIHNAVQRAVDAATVGTTGVTDTYGAHAATPTDSVDDGGEDTSLNYPG